MVLALNISVCIIANHSKKKALPLNIVSINYWYLAKNVEGIIWKMYYEFFSFVWCDGQWVEIYPLQICLLSLGL
jgi:hypothetical protein